MKATVNHLTKEMDRAKTHQNKTLIENINLSVENRKLTKELTEEKTNHTSLKNQFNVKYDNQEDQGHKITILSKETSKQKIEISGLQQDLNIRTSKV